jgi:nucleoside 2-deoxyribosyltransferase
MRAYIAHSNNHRDDLKPAIDCITQIIESCGHEAFVFTRHHTGPMTERELMNTTKREVDASDLLIAELSHKAIGVGIEIGYATAHHKPVIYIRKSDSEHSTTASGISKVTIEYADLDDLRTKLTTVLEQLT